MIHAKTTDRVAVAEHDHALANRLIVVGPKGRKTSGSAQGVRSRQVKSHDLVGRLPGNGPAENAVMRDGVAARACVAHRHRLVGRGRVQSIIEREALQAVRIMHLRGDDHRLVGGGNARRVRDIVHGGAGIGGILAVGGTRRAEIGRHWQGGGGVEPISIQTQQRFIPSMQPAGFIAQGDGLAAGEGIVGA